MHVVANPAVWFVPLCNDEFCAAGLPFSQSIELSVVWYITVTPLAARKLVTVPSWPSSGVRRKFSWRGFWFKGIWWSFAFGVRCL